MKELVYSDTPKFNKALTTFCNDAIAAGDVSAVVEAVLREVRSGGDAAVLRYTEKFDGAKLKRRTMRVTEKAMQDALASLSSEEKQAIRQAIKSVSDFHKRTLPKGWQSRNAQGGVVGERFYPIQRVGLYIPGGNVPLVSTVLMTAVPALVAKCPEIVVCTPPQKSGALSPGMLAALSLVGIKEVYRIGGVQAIGAMAYGTKTVPAVDKIYGPGNAFVMEAKRQVFGTVGVDLLPGPSEVMVIADSGANPRHVAADLLAQAEHGSGKEILYLVTTSKAFVAKVGKALEKQLPACTHAAAIRKVLDKRFLVVRVGTLSQAATVANYIAPEHLELQVAAGSIEKLTRSITTAGAILQGYSTPTVLGDFTAGPSHTLPTGRAGRYFSGLQVTDYLRRSSIVRYDAKALAAAAPVVEVFARLEQLDAHGNSLKIRLG